MIKLNEQLIFRPLTQLDLGEIMMWRYAPPYDVYNAPPGDTEDEWAYFADEQNGRFYAITTPEAELIAFCTFFADATVTGGDYSEEALDIGLGVRPNLTGLGKKVGLGIITAVLDFARDTFQPTLFRVTIAEFNTRAQRVWRQAGFQQGPRFGRTSDGMPFVIFTRDV